MPIHVQRAATADTSYEYGCDLRRLYPWPDVTDPVFWGSAIASVRPNEATSPHSHDEDETFIIMDGHGRIEVDEETSQVETGDVIFLPRGSKHSLANLSEEMPLVFLTIFWGSPEAKQAMARMLSNI